MLSFPASLLIMMATFQIHDVTASFVSPEGKPLVGIRVILSLPEGQGVFITNEKGMVTFKTASERVWFSVAGPGGNRVPYPLPDSWLLEGDQPSLRIIIDPSKIPGGAP